MMMKLVNNIIVQLLLLTFFEIGCTSDTPGLMTSLNEAPIITGIYVTTEEYPIGYGLVYGSPAPVEQIRVVPNPYIGRSFYQSSLIDKVVKIMGLPPVIRIEIYRGVFRESPELNYNLSGATTFSVGSRPIRTFNKSSQNSVLNWDLKDDNGHHVPSGLYKVYFIFENKKIESLDVYIIHEEDMNTWVDPTGWLPDGWNHRIFAPQ
ncbi:hypothetical protein JNL27_13745 [bacterium]|nr:hypothetical protein [bacterium]